MRLCSAPTASAWLPPVWIRLSGYGIQPDWIASEGVCSDDNLCWRESSVTAHVLRESGRGHSLLGGNLLSPPEDVLLAAALRAAARGVHERAHRSGLLLGFRKRHCTAGGHERQHLRS